MNDAVKQERFIRDKWASMLKAWACMDEHQNRVREAKMIIHSALNKARKPFVSFSGGKDSTCVLHLVLQQVPDVMVLHWDYGPYYIPRWLKYEFLYNATLIGVQNLRIEISLEYMRLKRNAVNVLGREYIGKVIPKLADEGYDLSFIGLRAEESLKRKRRIAQGKSLSCIKECWPIQNWSWKDVWAYIFSHGLPYASVYDRYAEIVGLQNVRLTTFFDSEFDKLGASNIDGIVMWKFKNVQ